MARLTSRHIAWAQMAGSKISQHADSKSRCIGVRSWSWNGMQCNAVHARYVEDGLVLACRGKLIRMKHPLNSVAEAYPVSRRRMPLKKENESPGDTERAGMGCGGCFSSSKLQKLVSNRMLYANRVVGKGVLIVKHQRPAIGLA